MKSDSANIDSIGVSDHHAAPPSTIRRSIGDELLDPHIYDDHGDPHRAALEDADGGRKVTLSTCLAVFFLGFTFQSCLSFTLFTVFVVLVPIALQLQGSMAHVSWMATAWSLAGSVAFAIAGQLSDLLGRKNVLVFGQALLIVGHIIGATAQSVEQIIGAMAVLGFGGGTTFVLYTAISELLPNVYRNVGVASTDIHVFLFGMFGPLLARALLEHATWRWLFYLGIITGVIAMVGTIIFYSPPSRPIVDRSRKQILRELDYLGIFLYTSGTALFLIGLAWGGNPYPWKSAQVLVPLLLGLTLFVLMFVWDFSRFPKRPLVSKRLFANFREFVSVVIVIFVAGLVFISISSIIPAEIAYVYTDDPIKAGYYNIAAGTAALFGGILGALVHKMKRIPLQLMVALAIQTISNAMMALITPDRKAMGLVFQFFANLPFPWILTISYVTVGLHVPQRDIGLAYGLTGSARFLGGAIGTAVLNVVLANRASVTIPSRVKAAVLPLGFPKTELPSLIEALLSGTTAELKGVSPDTVQNAARALKWGYSDAFRVTWLVTIPFGVMAFVAAIFVRDPSPYFTAHTAVTLDREQKQDRSDHNLQHLETVESGLGTDIVQKSE